MPGELPKNILLELGYDPTTVPSEREQFFLEKVVPQHTYLKTIHALKLLIIEEKSRERGSPITVKIMERDLHQLERTYRNFIWALDIGAREQRKRKIAGKVSKRKTRKKRRNLKHIPDRPAKGSVRFLTGRQ